MNIFKDSDDDQVCAGVDCTNERSENSIYCLDCTEDMVQIQNEFLRDGIDSGIFTTEDFILCPHCGMEQTLDEEDEYADEGGEYILTCKDCGLIYHLETNIITEYTSYRTDVK